MFVYSSCWCWCNKLLSFPSSWPMLVVLAITSLWCCLCLELRLTDVGIFSSLLMSRADFRPPVSDSLYLDWLGITSGESVVHANMLLWKHSIVCSYCLPSSVNALFFLLSVLLQWNLLAKPNSSSLSWRTWKAVKKLATSILSAVLFSTFALRFSAFSACFLPWTRHLLCFWSMLICTCRGIQLTSSCLCISEFLTLASLFGSFWPVKGRVWREETHARHTGVSKNTTWYFTCRW